MAEQIWEKSYPPNLSWGDPLPEPIMLEGYLLGAAQHWGDKPLIDFYERVLSFTDVRDLAFRVASGLQKLGVGPGVNVGLYLPNTPHYVACFFGILIAGGRVVNFGPLTGPRELKHQLADARIPVMITAEVPMFYSAVVSQMGQHSLETMVVCHLTDFLDEARVTALRVPRAKPVASAGRQVSFAELTTNEGKVIAHPRGKPQDEVAVLQYTGGTTGAPKGAMLTHANFSAVLNIGVRIGTAMFRPGAQGSTAARKTLVTLPLSHIGGLNSGVLAPMVSGSEMVLQMGFDAGQALEAIEKKRVTGFSGVPAMYTALVNHPAFKERDLSSLQGWAVGGAMMPTDIADRFQQRAGVFSHESYALTETTGYATFQLLGAEAPRQKSVGMPIPLTTIEIVDMETGMTVLPPGQQGEICLQGPQVMKGYWNDSAATEHAFRGGRFHSGDIGVMSEEGYLTVLDRKKDMILTGGFNIYPSRIEDAIYEHPSVADCGVVGVPHQHFGQVAKAYVVLREGAPAFTHTQLLEFLSDKLSRYEMPMELELRTALPRTPIGKLSKHELAVGAA